jgi:hypothetical protein
MRDKLKQILASPNIPDEYDLSWTIWIAKNLNSGRLELALKHQKETKKEAKTEEELETHADDIHWYAFEETFFIWHFCLWRLQAILEGIITGRFIGSNQNKKLPGLKAKLDALRAAGYTIEEGDYNELLEWAKIRNQLSHFPPSSHGIGPLEQRDVEEYYNLCTKICRHLTDQKQQRKRR